MFDEPICLMINTNNDLDASDPDSFGVSRIEGDLSSVYKLKQVVMQLNYQTQTGDELYSAFEESNKFESDLDFDLKSFLKKKSSRFQNGFKIEPTPVKRVEEDFLHQNLS